MTLIDSPDKALYARSTRASQFSVERVQRELDALANTSIVENIEKWIEMDKAAPGGRKEAMPVRALIVVMLMLQDEHAPNLKTEISNVFYQRLTPEARELLGIGGVKQATSWKAESDRWYHRADRCFTRMVDAMDPYPAPRKMMNTQERHFVEAQRDEETVLVKEARLFWFQNAMLEMTVRELPEDALAAWKGDIAVDQTKVPAVSKVGRATWRRKNGAGATAEPNSVLMELDADWYNHNADFHNTDDEKKRNFTWGYAANIALMALHEPPADETARVPHPTLAIGMKLGPPIRSSITEDTVNVLASIRNRGHKAGRVTGDKEYFAKYAAEKLALPVRALGYSPHTDYVVTTLGKNGHVGGAVQVEGKLYCPQMPKLLVEATKRKNEGTISAETYLRQVEEQRPQFEVQRKERPDESGAYPIRCPALGNAPTLTCSLADGSEWRTPNEKAANRTRREVTRPVMPDHICVKSSVMLRPGEDMRYLQDMRYGTTAWARTYKSDRNAIERLNSIVKDGAKEDLENTAIRRSRGFTAAAVFTTFSLVSVNRRLTRTWKRENQKLDATGRRTKRPRREYGSLRNYTPTMPMLHPDGTVTFPERIAS